MAATDPFVGLQYNWSPTTENFADGMDTNIKTIGAVLQLTVQSKTGNDPATLTPIDGQAWIVGPTPTGLWASHSKKIAAYIGGAWMFITPKVGWKAYIVAEDATAIYKGSPTPDWTNNPNGGGSINNAENLGTSGEGLFASINGDKLSFKKLVAGTGVTLSSDSETVVITTAAGGATMAINAQTGTAYTLDVTDAGNCVEMNNAAANQLTIPPNGSVAFGIGTTILVRQMGAGATTMVAGSGVTIRNPHGTLKLTKQYASVALHKRGTDEWCVEGNLAES